MFGKHKKQTDSSGFWAWLAANTSRIQAAGRDVAEDVAGELSRAFKKSYPDLVWEVTPTSCSANSAGVRQRSPWR